MMWYPITAIAGALLSLWMTVLVGGTTEPRIGSAISGAALAMLVIAPAARGSFGSDFRGERIPLSPRGRWIMAAIGVVVVIASGLIAPTFGGYANH